MTFAPARLLVSVLMLSACASGPKVAPASPGAPAGPSATPPRAGNGGGVSVPTAAASGASAPTVPATSASALPPFANVIKDARRIEGPWVLWQKEERLWLEVRPQDVDALFFLSPKLASGIGEAGIYGGLMRQAGIGGPKLLSLRRVLNSVQFVIPNRSFVAQPDTPAARAVRAAFADSLLGSAPVVSQPQTPNGAYLVDISGLFLADLAGVAQQLQSTFRQGWNVDMRNSNITRIRGTSTLTAVEVRGHYVSPGTTGAPVLGAATPRTLPDPRSLIVNVHYSLTRLPATPMQARLADARIGHFTTTVQDYSDDLARTPKRRYVNRWRLEKKDPTAEISEPVKPITFWVDPTVPDAYRDTIVSGILEWNKAFERIGFKDAIVVKVQGKDDDFDTLDTDRASVRWMTNASTMIGAIAPSHVDPRSGEILDADIAIESLSTRAIRQMRAQILPIAQAALSQGAHVGLADSPLAEQAHVHSAACQHASLGAEQLRYALDVLQAREGLDPDSPQAREFMLAYLKDTVMHETGHALGLRHNFRASSVRTEAELTDPAFTRRKSLSGSVMDYPAMNLAAPGAPAVTPFNVTLGAYDYWAVEYAYRPYAPEQEAQELQRLAARSAEPELAYATDEDHWLGMDPQVQTGDLGNDPLAFARRRIAIAQDLLRRQERRQLEAGAEPALLRRTVAYALRDAGQAALVAAKVVGGVRTLRDQPGSGRDPLQPVPAAQQREALALVSKVLRSEGLAVSPGLQRRLSPDFFERAEAMHAGAAVSTDYSPTQALLGVQAGLLNQLYSDAVAQRLTDSRDKLESAKDALSLRELFRTLDAAIWEGPTTDARRELQRVHVNLLASVLLRPAAYARGQARADLRESARALQQRVEKEMAVVTPDSAQQAHLSDVFATLRAALAAPLIRTTP